MDGTNLVFSIKAIAELIPTFCLFKHMIFPFLYVFTISDTLYFNIYFSHIILIKKEKMRLVNLSSYDDGTIVSLESGSH